MPDLTFSLRGASPVPFAASPMLGLELLVRSAAPDEPIRAVALRCQVWIEVQRRRVTAAEQEGLSDLFGAPTLWERSLRPLLWANASVMVPPFSGEATAVLPLACTSDFMVASARYLQALSGGSVPLLLLFSGTIFHESDGGGLSVLPVPSSKEARGEIPVSVIREALDTHYPGAAPLLLGREVMGRLHRYRTRHGFATWDEAIESLLDAPAPGGPR